MSTKLYWSTLPTKPKRESIDSLKPVVTDRFWNGDESRNDYFVIAGKDLIPFLEGIVVGNGSGDMARDAEKLIKAINAHGKVMLHTLENTK